MTTYQQMKLLNLCLANFQWKGIRRVL